MFAVGLVLSSISGIYLTNVLPTTSVGLRLKWYYPFSKSYWCGARLKPKLNRVAAADLSFEDESVDLDGEVNIERDIGKGKLNNSFRTEEDG